MKKRFLGLIATTLIGCLIASIGFIACNKGYFEFSNNPPMQEETHTFTKDVVNMIPIAKLTDKYEIELLFLQKDAQEYFNKVNPEKTLVFVEVVDDEEYEDEPGLLYRIYDESDKFSETSLVFALILNEGVYYFSSDLLNSRGISCTTSDCSTEVKGCIPKGTSSCTPCKNGGKCTKTVSKPFLPTRTITVLTSALLYATDVYEKLK